MIIVSVSSLSFNKVTVDQFTTKQFNVFNDSPTPATIEIVSGNPVFTSTYLNIIPPNDSIVVTTKFQPAVVQNYSSFLTIKDLTTGTPDSNVNLSGEGVKPTISVTPLSVVDFGTVSIQDDKTATFVVRNTSTDANLIVSGITLSDAINYSKNANTLSIPPNGSSQITITFAPTTIGSKLSNLQITSNASNEPLVSRNLQGVGLIPSASINTLSIQYGNVPITESKVESVVVTNISSIECNLLITSVTSDNPIFGVNSSYSTSINKGSSTQISISFNPTSTGPHSGTIQITTNDTNIGIIDVAVSGIGILASNIRVSPASLDFGKLEINTSLTKSFVISNIGVVELTGSITGDEDFTISDGSFNINPGTSKTINVVFNPTEYRDYSDILNINSNDPDAPTIDFNIVGKVKTPTLSVTDELDFGKTNANVEILKDLVIRNAGEGKLNITSVTSNDSKFTVLGFPTSINGNQTGTISLKFIAANNIAANYNAILTITSDDLNSPKYVTLKAETVQDKAIIASVPSLSFNKVTVDQFIAKQFDIFNSNQIPVTIEIVSGNPVFTSSYLKVIPPNNKVAVTVIFEPTTVQSYQSFLTIKDLTTSTPDFNVNLSGEGVKPTISVVPLSVNFGTVSIEDKKTTTLTVQNTSTDADLIISNITLSNIIDYSTNITTLTIPPNSGSSQIIVTFSPTTAGSISSDLQIISNATNLLAPIALQGVGIIPSAEIDTNTIDYGNVPINESKTERVIVANISSSECNLLITSVTSDNPLFVVTGYDSFIEKDGSTQIDIRFNPTALVTSSGIIQIETNSDIGIIDVVVSGIGILASNIRVSPESLDFGKLEINTSLVKPFVISNIGTVALNGSITGSNANFTISDSSFIINPNESKTINVGFNPTEYKNYENTLNINSDDPESQSIQISLVGKVKTPELSVTDELDFGKTNINTAISKDLVIRNIGDGKLNISRVECNLPIFTIGSFASSVDGNGTTKIPLTFNASTNIDNFDAILIITSDSDSPKEVILRVETISPTLSVDELDFGKTNINTAISKDLVIRNIGEGQLTIVSVVIDDARYEALSTFPIIINGNQTGKISLKFESPIVGTSNTTLHINSNIGVTDLALMANIIEDMPLISSTSSIQFGKITKNTLSTKQFTLFNESQVDITISIPSYDNFEAIYSPIIPAGDSSIVSIKFIPTEQKIYSLDLIISSNTTTKTIKLFGEGIESSIAVPPDDLNFSDVAVQDYKNLTLEIENNSEAILDISSITVDNNVFTVSASSLQINPGKKSSLTVKFSPLTTVTQNGILTLTNNSLNNSSVKISLTGSGKTPTFTVDKSEINFGEVNINTTKTDIFEIKNTSVDSVNLKINSISVNDSHFTVNYSNSSITKDSKLSVEVMFNPESNTLPISGILTVITNGGTETIDLAGKGRLAPIISTDVEGLNFGTVSKGGSATQTFSIENNGQIELSGTIELVEDPLGSFSVSPKTFLISPSTSQLITVEFSPKQYQSYTGHLVIKSNDPVTPEINPFNLLGSAKIPKISTNLTTLDFGKVGINTEVDKIIRIANTGTEVLSVTPTTSYNLFTLVWINEPSGPPLTGKNFINVGQYKDLIVKFKSSSVIKITQTAKLILTSDDPSNKVKEIELSAETVATDISIVPKKLDFGKTANGFKTKPKEVEIFNIGPVELRITSITGSATFSTSTTDNPPQDIVFPFIIAANFSRKILIYSTPTVIGDYSGIVTLHASTDLNIECIGSGGVPKIEVSEEPINFGNSPLGAEKTVALKITNTGDCPLIITPEIDSSIEGIFYVINVLEIQDGDKDKRNVKNLFVSFIPPADIDYLATLTLNTNTELSPTIDLLGKGIKSGVIKVTPESIDFGSTARSNKKNATITISNVGSDVLTISHHSFQDPDNFGSGPVKSPPAPPPYNIEDVVEIQVGQSKEVSIYFDPQTDPFKSLKSFSSSISSVNNFKESYDPKNSFTCDLTISSANNFDVIIPLTGLVATNLEWIRKDISLPDYLKDPIDSVVDKMDSVITALEFVLDITNIVKKFIIGISNPLIIILDQLHKTLKELIDGVNSTNLSLLIIAPNKEDRTKSLAAWKNFEATSLFNPKDKEELSKIFEIPDPFNSIKGGYKMFENKIIASFDDIADSNRPQMATTAFGGGIVFAIDSDVDLAPVIQVLTKFLNLIQNSNGGEFMFYPPTEIYALSTEKSIEIKFAPSTSLMQDAYLIFRSEIKGGEKTPYKRLDGTEINDYKLVHVISTREQYAYRILGKPIPENGVLTDDVKETMDFIDKTSSLSYNWKDFITLIPSLGKFYYSFIDSVEDSNKQYYYIICPAMIDKKESSKKIFDRLKGTTYSAYINKRDAKGDIYRRDESKLTGVFYSNVLTVGIPSQEVMAVKANILTVQNDSFNLNRCANYVCTLVLNKDKPPDFPIKKTGAEVNKNGGKIDLKLETGEELIESSVIVYIQFVEKDILKAPVVGGQAVFHVDPVPNQRSTELFTKPEILSTENYKIEKGPGKAEIHMSVKLEDTSKITVEYSVLKTVKHTAVKSEEHSVGMSAAETIKTIRLKYKPIHSTQSLVEGTSTIQDGHVSIKTDKNPDGIRIVYGGVELKLVKEYPAARGNYFIVKDQLNGIIEVKIQDNSDLDGDFDIILKVDYSYTKMPLSVFRCAKNLPFFDVKACLDGTTKCPEPVYANCSYNDGISCTIDNGVSTNIQKEEFRDKYNKFISTFTGVIPQVPYSATPLFKFTEDFNPSTINLASSDIIQYIYLNNKQVNRGSIIVEVAIIDSSGKEVKLVDFEKGKDFFINEEDAFDGRIKIDFSKLQETEQWKDLATTKITVSYNTNLEAMSNKKVIKYVYKDGSFKKITIKEGVGDKGVRIRNLWDSVNCQNGKMKERCPRYTMQKPVYATSGVDPDWRKVPLQNILSFVVGFIKAADDMVLKAKSKLANKTEEIIKFIEGIEREITDLKNTIEKISVLIKNLSNLLLGISINVLNIPPNVGGNKYITKALADSVNKPTSGNKGYTAGAMIVYGSGRWTEDEGKKEIDKFWNLIKMLT